MNPRKVFDAALCAVCAAFAALFFAAMAHGYIRDMRDDGLHERGTCGMCGFYRWMHSDDAAFEARELRRAAK